MIFCNTKGFISLQLKLHGRTQLNKIMGNSWFAVYTPITPPFHFQPLIKKTDLKKVEAPVEIMLDFAKIFVENVNDFVEIPYASSIVAAYNYLTDKAEAQFDDKVNEIVSNKIKELDVILFHDRLYDIQMRLDIVQKRLQPAESYLTALKRAFSSSHQMQMEITSAMSTCDQIYHHFAHEDSTFFNSPLASPPFLSLFAVTYIIVLQLANQFCPESYGNQEFVRRKGDMAKLIDTYTDRFFCERLSNKIIYRSMFKADPFAENSPITDELKDLCNPEQEHRMMKEGAYNEWSRRNKNLAQEYKRQLANKFHTFFASMYFLFVPTAQRRNFSLDICEKYI